MGPFGVLARCLTVAHGALLLLFPKASLPVTGAVLCLIVYFFAANKKKIVSALGMVLTPLLLFSIALIAFFGVYKGGMSGISTGFSFEAFKTGIFQGYQTMDLLAAFFFSQFMMKHLGDKIPPGSGESSVGKLFYKSSFIGALLLSAVYFVLVLLGGIYASSLEGVPAQEMLGKIALLALGSRAAPCVCLAVIFACMTTIIVLASLFADFFREKVMQRKIGNRLSLGITLTIGFIVSTFDFSAISHFLGPLLEVIYPALIVLTVVNIFYKLFGRKASHWPFTLALLAKLSWV